MSECPGFAEAAMAAGALVEQRRAEPSPDISAGDLVMGLAGEVVGAASMEAGSSAVGAAAPAAAEAGAGLLELLLGCLCG